jgi:hypothetical protein
MVAYYDGTWLGDFTGPASWGRVAASARREGSLAVVLDRLGVSHLVLPRTASPWLELARADPCLAETWADSATRVFRVAAGRESWSSSCTALSPEEAHR